MKITFVYPRFEKFLSATTDIDRGLVDYYLGDFTTPPSLGIPIMAAWTPADIEVELIDDNAGDAIDYGARTDLVAINCFTPQATRAFEIADGFRAAGTKVIMGGFFPSFMADECLKHADSVGIGEVEPIWLKIIEDVRAGQLQPRYKGGCHFDVAELKIPRRELFYAKDSYDWDEDLIQITRGCLYNCAMCAIPAHMGSRIRFRPIDKVIEEIATLKFENVYLADDTLFFPQKRINQYARELFERLIPFEKKYFVASTMALNIEPDFLDLAARAGVCNFYCTMNVDPISIRALAGEKREVQQLIDLVKILEDRQIRFFGSFALGRDWDDESIADRVLELYTKANIHTSEFFLFTPYPGSVQWDRLERQGRIFDKNWSHYNGAHVVAHHPKLSDEALWGQFVKVWSEFCRMQKQRHATHLEPATYKEGKLTVGKPLQRKGVGGQAVVTGMGVLSPLGNDLESITDALHAGQHGLAPITRFATAPFRTSLGGEIRNFDPSAFLSPREIDDYQDRYLQYAISAARQALAHAGVVLAGEGGIRRDIALVLGTCNGGLLSAEEEYRWKHGKSDKAFDEKMNLQAQLYGFGKALSAALGIGGECWVITTACSSTTGALGMAQMLVNSGLYRTVLVGGSDALCVANMAGFNGIKAVSTTQTAPFSLPEGLNIGEAACFWVVEEMEHALLRNAHCLARLAGHATTCDAYHPTSPDPRGDGVYRTLSNATADAGVTPGELGCVNTHGTGTAANDRAESKGIARFLNGAAVPAISLKSFFGHCMGSTGLLEATCNVLAMNQGFIPPTVNFTQPRPGCTLDYVPNEAREVGYDAFVSANYAFGGNNAAVVITNWQRELSARTTSRARVVITGTGTVTALGLGSGGLVEALAAAQCGIGPVGLRGLEPLGAQRAGLVESFDGAQVDRRIDFSGMNKISQMATAAARMALDEADYKIGRKNAESSGVAMGICNGPDEMAHMDSVFSSENCAADLASFSNIVANSTAGWVANALSLKGVNTTVAPGHHAGLQALAWAFLTLGERRAQMVLAGAADELYPQTWSNYNLIGYLYEGGDEEDFRIRPQEPRRKVLGEGAAVVAMETLDSARERGATVLGEVLGYGMSMDGGGFSEPARDAEGMAAALRTALERSSVGIDEIDLLVWAPQGNGQDLKVVEAVERVFGERAAQLAFRTTTFATGYIESASILVSLAATLRCIAAGQPLWPQRTGLDTVDNRPLPQRVRTLVACGSSDVGFNAAVVVRVGACQ